MPTHGVTGLENLVNFGELNAKRLFRHDPDNGGTLCIMTGEQGSGKTTLLIRLALTLMGKEYVIWRGRSVAQWHKIPQWEENIKLFFHTNNNPKIYKLKGEKSEEINVKYYRYKTPKDLLKKIEKNRINVVYEPKEYSISNALANEIEKAIDYRVTKKERESRKSAYFWYELMYELIRRKDRRWIALFLDECDEIFPENPKGLQWKLQLWLKDNLKDARKAYVSVFASTHALGDVDWRIRNKFQAFIYLKGAKVSEKSMVNKSLPLRLTPGTGIIDWGTFGIFTYKPIPSPGYDIVVETETRKTEGEKKPKKTKPKYPAEIIREIAEQEGYDEALKALYEMRAKREISLRTFQRIRKKLEKYKPQGV